MTELERLRARVEDLEHHFAEIDRELNEHAGRWPFHIQKKAALVLAILAKYHGKTLSKEVIWRHLYGLRPDADQPTLKGIDVFIFRARVKLRRYGITIQTVYGTGYMIDDDNHAKLMALAKQPFGVRPEVFKATLEMNG